MDADVTWESGNVLGGFEGGLYGALSDDATADLETMLEEDLLGTLDFLLGGCHTGDVRFKYTQGSSQYICRP